MLQKLADVFHRQVLGMNRRNADVIYRNHTRKDFTVADDKVVTKQLLEPAGIPVPQTYAILHEIRELQEAWERIAQLSDLVIKPANGRAGQKILVLKRTADGWATPGGTHYSAGAIQRHIADIIYGTHASGAWDRAIVESRVVAHPFFRAIYEAGLPDVRVIAYQGTLVQAMCRIPTAASDGKANLHQGALGVRIDLETGRLGQGYNYAQYHPAHPDSGVRFAGRTMPSWDAVRAISLGVCDLVPLDYLGIDIVLDETQGPLVMEINARPGLEIQNVNQQGLREQLTALHP